MHLWDDKIGTLGSTYRSPRTADDVGMTSVARIVAEGPRAESASCAPRLRLLPKGPRTCEVGEREEMMGPDHRRTAGSQLAAPATDSPVLIAGRDALKRAEVHREMSELMPAGTCFEELDAFWEVLVRAPSSRMVILSGELDELPAESLLHTLGHRHPDLPVVSLEAEARS